jgi:hypothetical protein
MMKRLLLALSLAVSIGGAVVACNTPAGTTSPTGATTSAPASSDSLSSDSVGSPAASDAMSAEPSAS